MRVEHTDGLFHAAALQRRVKRLDEASAGDNSGRRVSRASAAETALMIPAAAAAAKSYDELAMPVIIIAGENDRLIDIDEQSGRLHDEVRQSKMHRITGAGHMVQQSATGAVMAAIDEAAEVLQEDRRSEVR